MHIPASIQFQIFTVPCPIVSTAFTLRIKYMYSKLYCSCFILELSFKKNTTKDKPLFGLKTRLPLQQHNPLEDKHCMLFCWSHSLSCMLLFLLGVPACLGLTVRQVQMKVRYSLGSREFIYSCLLL